jgi:hypothetical protein
VPIPNAWLRVQAIPSFAYVVLYSFLPHKELRFLFPGTIRDCLLINSLVTRLSGGCPHRLMVQCCPCSTRLRLPAPASCRHAQFMAIRQLCSTAWLCFQDAAASSGAKTAAVQPHKGKGAAGEGDAKDAAGLRRRPAAAPAAGFASAAAAASAPNSGTVTAAISVGRAETCGGSASTRLLLRALNALVRLGLAGSFTLAALFLLASAHNYPGGDALRLLHARHQGGPTASGEANSRVLCPSACCALCASAVSFGFLA